MRYFKHMVDAHRDELVEEAMLKFGSDGYTAWFVTAELVAKVVKIRPGGKVTARLEADPRTFLNATKIPIDRLEKVYEWLTKKTKGRKFRFKITNDSWIVEFPKVLEFKDEYTEQLLRQSLAALGSDSGASSLGVEVSTPLKEGIQGEVSIRGDTGGPDDNQLVWERQIMPGWEKLCEAPSYSTKRKHIRDWIRQGVGRRAIEEAPMMPEFRRMDFFDIGNELKRRANGNGERGHKGLNPGAKEILGHFALRPGELDEQMRRRIADRERREREAQGDAGAKDRGDGGGVAQGDQVPGPEKV